jgi:hypothetical protein
MSDLTTQHIDRMLMAVESTEVNTTPAGYKFLALMNVIFWAVVGGYIM